MQLGPGAAALEAADSPSKEASATRVVAGLEAFHAQAFPKRGLGWAVMERSPMGTDGSISTSHWLLEGSVAGHNLHIRNLQV